MMCCCCGPVHSRLLGATSLVLSSTVLFRGEPASCMLYFLFLLLIHKTLLCALSQPTLKFLVQLLGLLQRLLEFLNLFLYNIGPSAAEL